LAKAVAASLIAGWRLKLLAFSDSGGRPMDLEQLVAGHPTLKGSTFIALADAARITSLSKNELLRYAEQARLNLFVRFDGLTGYLLPEGSLEQDHGPLGTEIIVPMASDMQGDATHVSFAGHAQVRDAHVFATAILALARPEAVLFDVPNRPGLCFAPDSPVALRQEQLELRTNEVELIRLSLARVVTPLQLEIARRAQSTKPAAPVLHLSQEPVSAAVRAYIPVRQLYCEPDQVRRVQGALELFVELEGDPMLCDIDSARLKKYRDQILPTVPANENKIRLTRKTKSITESIRAIEGTDWPRISKREQVKRLQWLASMFVWLKESEWIEKNPAAVLLKESSARAALKKEKKRAKDARDAFTREDLQIIFSFGSWFKTGRGELTKSNTYREFCPYYYWLPMLGIFTGARINELSQIFLSDIRESQDGTWFCDIAILDDEGGKKRRKNASSVRRIPLHKQLINAGIIDWKRSLESAGFKRLFPELKHDATKGYGKAPTRWFSRYLAAIGWDRNGRKVFHSFRATLVSECVNRLRLTEAETAQISGHSRDASVMIDTYAKDEVPKFLVRAVNRLDFNLPSIAPFDCKEGLKAVRHALRRKDRGQGAVEDV